MSTKSEISSNYQKSWIDATKQWYRNVENPKILMIGTDEDTGIGRAIRLAIKQSIPYCTIVTPIIDVTKKIKSIDGDIGYGDYDALIMCHGANAMGWLENISYEDMMHLVNVNLLGTMNMVSAFVEATINHQMRKTIISIGSMAYKHILNASAPYCASKAGAAHYMKCAAWELAPKGYNVFSVHPSNVNGTPMHKSTVDSIAQYRGISREEAEAYWSDNFIRGRSLSKEEIASLCIDLLIGKAADFLSGSNLELTGGQR